MRKHLDSYELYMRMCEPDNYEEQQQAAIRNHQHIAAHINRTVLYQEPENVETI